MEEYRKNSPWMSLMILLGLTFACGFVLQVLVLLGIVVGTGDLNSVINSGGSFYPEDPIMLYILLGTSSLATFLLPSLILQQIEKKQFQYFPASEKNFGKFLILSFVFLLASNPAMELISKWNMNMQLPELFKETEAWMQSKEKEMAELTSRLVMVDRIDYLVMNLLVMAVIPAIVEEFFFRGALQGIFVRLFKNIHVAIWVTAIIFSAIHVQFYGFFPRMLLGLIFGYAFIWSKNIWVPVFAHFINNASVTILAFYYAREGKTIDDMQNAVPYTMPVYIGSLLLSTAVALYFYKISLEKNKQNGIELEEVKSV